MHTRQRISAAGQTTLEWVIGAAIILATLVSAVYLWNQSLAHEITNMVQKIPT